MTDSEPNVLVLTLYAGEHELDDAISALQAQTYTRWTHRIFRYLNNVEAHRTLYECIMESTDEFDMFVKLDADMIFSREGALADIVDELTRHRELDHAVFAVKDWASRTNIMGLHVYSNRVRWKENDETLFVDPRPEIPGERKLYWASPAPVAEHMPDPSPEQARLFGYHRALKLVQRGRLRKSVEQAETQWALLQNVWNAYQLYNDQRRVAVLRGAEQAFASRDATLADKSQANQTYTYDEKEAQDLRHPPDWFAKRWEPGNLIPRWRRLRWVQIPGWLIHLSNIVRFRYAGRGETE